MWFRNYKTPYLLIMAAFTISCGAIPAQSSPWSSVTVTPVLDKALSELGFVPNKYSLHVLDEAQMVNDLKTASQIEIPTAKGNLLTVRIKEASVMAPELAAKYPTIRTFKASAIDRPAVFGNLGTNDLGFHAMLFTEGGHRLFIDKRVINNSRYYIAYLDKDYHPPGKPSIKTPPQVLKRN